MLDSGIQSHVDIGPWRNIKLTYTLGHHPATQPITLDDRRAGLAAEIRIVIPLYSLKPLGIAAHEADDLTGEPPLWIVPLGLIEHPNSTQPQRPYPLSLPRGHLPLEPDKRLFPVKTSPDLR